MRIELDFAVEKDDFDSFEDLVKYIKRWERSASKNRNFSGVKIVKIEEENDRNGWPTVTFEGSEPALRKLFNAYCGVSKKEQKDYDGDFEAMVVSEAENDGWDGDETIHDSGLFDFVNRFEKFSYALRHNTRASAKWGDTNKDLAEYCNELGDELKEIALDIDETIGESKKKLNEIDYGENNARRKHFKASDRKAKYWIYASDTDLSHINYFVKINWETKKPYLAPVKTLDHDARTDLRPFMTESPAKIHAVALMVSKAFPKFWFNIQDEAYRETTLSRFNNTARPAGTGIIWDPKLGTWTGGIDEKLPPPEKISKKDDLFRDKNEKDNVSNKYEKMDPRKLPYEKSRLEKEVARAEKTVDDIKKSGNKSGKQEKFEAELERLKAELEQVNALIG